MADTVHAVTIIGSGPAGYTAEIFAINAAGGQVDLFVCVAAP